MLTKYYSEILKKDFNTEKECLEAEEKYNKEHAAELALKAERADAAKAVEEKFKAANDMLKEANDALKDFCGKYGSYHTTIKNVPDTRSLVDFMFDSFFM